MRMMKRTRLDEIQYGSRTAAAGVGGGGGPGSHHRILTSQHNTGSTTIQYQLAPASSGPGVLKANVTQDSTSGVGGGGGGTIGGPQQTVQYSTPYAAPMAGGGAGGGGGGGGGILKSGAQSQTSGVVIAGAGGSNSGGVVGIGGAGAVGGAATGGGGAGGGIIGAGTGVGAGAGTGAATPVSGGQLHVVNSGLNSANQMRHKTTAITGGSGNANISPQIGFAGPHCGGQRLKVEDALHYLDQVKFKYADKPQIYNNFLDIMKEFKSQCIDTPGVIQRVSNLFKGHTELIYGFNMFLPPGYKIEIQANDQGISVPVVSMPTSPGGTVPCLPHTSPVHKSGSIVHQIPTNAVNLITHSCTNAGGPVGENIPPSIHNAMPLSQPSPAAAAAAQIVAPPTPTNYSRERSGSIVGQPAASTLTELNSQGHNLHHISQAHQSIETGGQQNQPVEFNHAISYVNKIKNRFQSEPEKYKRFLEILHTYQKEQKVLKEGTGTLPQGKQLTEAEVYTQVAKLFDQNDDLLREFGQFLPDATSHSTAQYMNKAHNDHTKKMLGTTVGTQPHSGGSTGNFKSYNNSQNNLVRMERDGYDKDFHSAREKDRNHVNQKFGHNSSQMKKSPSYNSFPVSHIGRRSDDRDCGPPAKRHKPICRDVTFSEASRHGKLVDAAFFDKLRKALRQPEVYDNFLRCLTLFNQEILSKSELLSVVSPFLGKFPDLHRWFQDFLESSSTMSEPISLATTQRQDRSQGSELAQEIDLASCKRLGASYCALPKTSEPKKCSGRTNLCREVLNDTWVSFPTWSSEDSTFVTSRKTQFEEIIYRCEDERFELDVVIETNSSTIRVLEGVHRKLSRMSQEEVARFRLDDCLGGTSPTIHQRALRRIYGDKSAEIIQGLKRNPIVAVPVVLKRLKAKEEEWREAQKTFNKQWREQNEKYYLKSLDHQAINFKANDVKMLRSKSLLNEIETLFEERHEQSEDNSSEQVSGPHLILPYKDKTILDDAANLLIHHVKRQTGIQKQEKTKIKHILRQFVPDLFFSPRQPLSDDERDDDDKEMDVDPSDSDFSTTKNGNENSMSALGAANSGGMSNMSMKKCEIRDSGQSPIAGMASGEGYSPLAHSSCATPHASSSSQNVSSSNLITSSSSSSLSSSSDGNKNNDKIDVCGDRTQISKIDDNRLNMNSNIRRIINSSELVSSSYSSSSTILQNAVTLSGNRGVGASAITCGNSNSIDNKVISGSCVDTTLSTTGLGASSLLLPSASAASSSSSSNHPSDGKTLSTIASGTVGSRCIENDTGSATSDIKVEIKNEIKDETIDLDANNPPLPPHAISKHAEEAYTLFFGNHSWYLFLRLHAILCDRLRTMYERALALAVEEEKYRSNRRESAATALKLKPKSEIQVEDYYLAFLDMLKNVLDGNMDANNYEDSLREMFGIHAYIAFTLDRVVSNAVRQLQHCVTERGALECVEIFHAEQKRDAAGGLCRTAHKRLAAELAYQRQAESILHEENCFKVYIYKIDCRVTIELLDSENDENEKNVSNTQAWSKYVDRWACPTTNSVSGTSAKNRCGALNDSHGSSDIKTEDLNLSPELHKPLYLQRNIRCFNIRYASTKNKSNVAVMETTPDEKGSISQIRVESSTSSTALTAITCAEGTTGSGGSTVTTTTSTASTVTAATVTTTVSTATGTGTATATTTAGTTNNNNTIITINSGGSSNSSCSSSGMSGGSSSTNPFTANSIDRKNSFSSTAAGKYPLWGKRPSTTDRVATNSGVNDNYYIDDQEEVKINQKSYKMLYVINKNILMYKRNSVRRARETHRRVTQKMQNRFQTFVNKWLDDNVSEMQRQQCIERLMGNVPELSANVTVIQQDNDVRKTPYKLYNRYKINRNDT